MDIYPHCAWSKLSINYFYNKGEFMSILYFPEESKRININTLPLEEEFPRLEEIPDPVMPKALSIDNSKICQKINTILLKKLGCWVELAETAQETLEKITLPYEIIFLEILLPNFDVALLLDFMRHHEGSLHRKTPIAIISSGVTSTFKKKCFSMGADAVFSKPMRLQDFKFILRRFNLI
jgi:two-component system, sensor histidine kinase RetS